MGNVLVPLLSFTSVPAPYVPNLSLCSGLCSAGVGAQAGWGQPRCDSWVQEAFLGTKWQVWEVLNCWFSVRLSPAKAPGQTQWGLRSVQSKKCCRILWLTTPCWGCLNSKDEGNLWLEVRYLHVCLDLFLSSQHWTWDLSIVLNSLYKKLFRRFIGKRDNVC